MRIDVWSDIACPWCWLGKRHLEEALSRAGIAADVRFHSFELQPGAGRARLAREYLAERYGSTAAIDAAQGRLAEAGAHVGLRYDFERQLMANTFDAHRVHHLAIERGLGAPVMERLMRAHHAEGADLSDRAQLTRVAVDAGLDAADVERVLAGDAYADAVREDEALARQLGVSGVPFFVIDGRLALAGAQPIEVFERALAQAAASPRQ